MKAKVKRQRIIGAVMIALGILVLIYGLVVKSRVDSRKDISQLKAKDIKDGVYVSGTFSGVCWTVSKKDTGEAHVPVVIRDEESGSTSDGASQVVFLTNCAEKSGKYLCMNIDEYTSTDMFLQVTSGRFIDSKYMDDTFEYDGVITERSVDVKAIKKFIKNWKKQCDGIYFKNEKLEDISEGNVMLYTLEVRDLSGRRFWWVYSTPLLAGGMVLMLYTEDKKKAKRKK